MPNILVIEDDTSLRETLAYNLSKQDYSVQAVGDGISGLETARKKHPDLVLLDLMLPGMDMHIHFHSIFLDGRGSRWNVGRIWAHQSDLYQSKRSAH